jgi:hypothetical protein
VVDLDPKRFAKGKTLPEDGLYQKPSCKEFRRPEATE